MFPDLGPWQARGWIEPSLLEVWAFFQAPGWSQQSECKLAGGGRKTREQLWKLGPGRASQGKGLHFLSITE
jgi:hypothetical protein